MWSYVFTFTGGAAAGAVLGVVGDRIMMQRLDSQNADKSKILEECFGEPMCTDTFTIQEAKGWIAARRSHIENGAKAVIMKVNDETLKKLGKDLSIGKMSII